MDLAGHGLVVPGSEKGTVTPAWAKSCCGTAGLVFDHPHEKSCGLLAAREGAWCGLEDGSISAPQGGQQQPWAHSTTLQGLSSKAGGMRSTASPLRCAWVSQSAGAVVLMLWWCLEPQMQ